MKKQISILAFLVVATFASVNISYGQSATKGSAPRGVSCTDDALHPLAGKEYTYQAASNQAGNYTFWATKDYNFITTTGTAPTLTTTTNMAAKKLTIAAGDLLTATNYAAAAATDNVKITWSDAALKATTTAAPTFVVVNQDGVCANNLKVWSIEPIVAFTVDIMNMNHSTLAPIAYNDITESQCFDAVRGAAFNFVSKKVDYNFGTQVLYWEVVAANFSVEYTPTFTITGLGNGQTAVIQWDEVPTFASPTAAVAIVNATSIASASKVTTSVANTSLGISIYVRVTITNNTYEGINPTPVTLAVDGQNSVGDWDIINNTVAAPTPLTCTIAAAADKTDAATQILNPRPTVTPVTPTPFVPTNVTN